MGRGGAGRGGARSGRTGHPFALWMERRAGSSSSCDVLRRLGEAGGEEPGVQRPSQGSPKAPPPQPSTQGGGTTCGGGGRAGGGS